MSHPTAQRCDAHDNGRNGADRYERLKDLVAEFGSVAVAFSGGVDSSLVLKICVDALGKANVVAVTGRSASLAVAEFEHARAVATQIGAEHVNLDTNEFQKVEYTSNPTNRCYFCKSTLYTAMRRFVEERGLACIASGTNADDQGDHRPGLIAARQFGVREPLAEAGLTKLDVRRLAAGLGLPNCDKPASPCLSSRIPYGEEVTPQKLHMVEQAESLLHELGFAECRVRHHGAIARIEVPPAAIGRLTEPDIAKRVESHLQRLGFDYVTVDLAGFRSGRLNELVPLGIASGSQEREP